MFKMQQEQQCTYKRTTEIHLRSQRCRGKATSFSYSECVTVALIIQHSNRMNRVAICGLSGSTTFCLLYLIIGTILRGEKSY